jgi:hypothetical protein
MSSGYYAFKFGVPQGFILGPLLTLLFTGKTKKDSVPVTSDKVCTPYRRVGSAAAGSGCN